jgi:squalene cyclase
MRNDRKKGLERARDLSLEYILSRQQPDGSWIDWDLPPGQSSIWTTAFVGTKLASLTSRLKEQASTSIDLASQWLTGRMFPDGGWGYNEEVGSDADSTALAILFLASAGKNVPESSYACLQSFQCTDGGFATFRGQPNLGSWAVSHADVTPSAVFAMMTKDGTPRANVDRGLQYVLNHKSSDGIWPSFWWTSFLYSTERSLSLIKTAGLNIDLLVTRTTLLHTRPQHPFESALLISSLLCMPDIALDQDIWPLVDELLEAQEPDGSWRSGPMLRVTRRDCLEAWKPGDPDQLYRDQNHLFTTATVLDALSKVSILL